MLTIAKRSATFSQNNARPIARQAHTSQPPRLIQRQYRNPDKSCFCERLRKDSEAWDKERETKFMKVDFEAMAKTRKVCGSTFAEPWAVELVSDETLAALKAETDDYATKLAALPRKNFLHRLPDNPNIFGIGPLKEPLNQNLFENGPIPVGKSITITRAGEQIAGPIERSPYDVRDFKYLFAISPYGLHTVREMTPWRTNARGIVGHPQLAEQAAIGGEAFFDPDNRGTVYINFGSGRFPPGSTQAMDAAAKYWLACGMDKVVAVFSDRDFKVQAYELKDRYGKDLPNKVYLRANPIAAERVDSEFMPSVRTDQMVL